MQTPPIKYEQIALFLKEQNIENEELLTNLIEIIIKTFKENNKESKNIQIPLSIFKGKDLGILELIVKYLKENNSLKLCNIAILLNRDERTIWAVYQNSKKKQKEEILVEDSTAFIPTSIFQERKYGPLECLVKYLKENLGYNFTEITKLINKSYSTIWITYEHSKKKG